MESEHRKLQKKFYCSFRGERYLIFVSDCTPIWRGKCHTMTAIWRIGCSTLLSVKSRNISEVNYSYCLSRKIWLLSSPTDLCVAVGGVTRRTRSRERS